ncbi:unnamed protein product [Auanema sp. JU1783]|nr:unnamed protein product [Auanema sp. JU1783]
MGTIESKVDVDKITREVNAHPVFIFTKEECSFCSKSKSILKQENIPFTECTLDTFKKDNPGEYQSFVNGLVFKTRQTTLPQIFICGRFVGGYTELEKLKNTKSLLDVISECS